MNRTFGLLIGLCALCCVGCVPKSYVARPAASGVVVDARTGEPIAGATVQMRGPLYANKDGSYRTPEGATSVTATTDAQGRFTLPQRKGMLMDPAFPGDRTKMVGLMQVEHAGYETKNVVLSEAMRDGIVRLHQNPAP